MQTNTPAKSSQNPLQSRQRNMHTLQELEKRNHLSRQRDHPNNMKKRITQKNSRQKEQQSYADLFSSARRAIDRGKSPSEHPSKKGEKKVGIKLSPNKFQDSTASRDFKLRAQQYDNPNGEYFGSKISINYRKKSRSNKKERDKNVLQLTKSLQTKVRHLRRMESLHSSESESLKSDISEKEMRRLEKIHSMERLQLMEEIIGIEEKIIRKKKKRV